MTPEQRATVAIPARLQSTRLPRKVLVDILGKPMLERTYEVATRAAVGPVLVLTDSEEVAGRGARLRRRGDAHRVPS